MPITGEFPALPGGRRRMHEEHLLALQDVLDERLVDGELQLDDYLAEWRALLLAAGYTNDEYVKLVEKRWDRIQQLRARPIHRPMGN